MISGEAWSLSKWLSLAIYLEFQPPPELFSLFFRKILSPQTLTQKAFHTLVKKNTKKP